MLQAKRGRLACPPTLHVRHTPLLPSPFSAVSVVGCHDLEINQSDSVQVRNKEGTELGSAPSSILLALPTNLVPDVNHPTNATRGTAKCKGNDSRVAVQKLNHTFFSRSAVMPVDTGPNPTVARSPRGS